MCILQNIDAESLRILHISQILFSVFTQVGGGNCLVWSLHIMFPV